MDVYNGDIVSLVSSPTFEPNEFVHGLDKAYWNKLIKDDKKPLVNKAYQAYILLDLRLKL